MKLVNGRRVGRLSAPELGTVLSLRSDGTVQSALIKASTKKTLTQTYQRLKMPNLGSFHKASKEALRKAFENSVINIFAELVSYNATSEMMPVGITKQQKKAGACVVMPYKITDGSLRPITVDGRNSSIIVTGLDGITAATKIGDFAKAVIENNPDFQYDDKLCFIQVKQLMSGEIPVASVACDAINLVKDSEETFGGLGIDLKGFDIDGAYLSVKGTPAQGGFAWIHTRKNADGSMELSSQNLILADNDAFVARYTSPEALRAAAESYKVDVQQFAMLEPNTLKERKMLKAFGIRADVATSIKSADPLQIVSVEFNGKLYTAGDVAPVLDKSVAETLVVNLNEASVLGNSIQCKINGATVNSPVRSGNKITMTIPNDADGMPLMVVGVMDPTHSVRLEF